MMHPRRQLGPADLARHGEMLANRVKKTWRKLQPRFERENIGAYRLYDWDIPEVRAVVDWYEGHLVVAEYARRLTDEAEGDWLQTIATATAAALEVPPERLHLRRRETRPESGERYGRLAQSAVKLPVREGDLRFLVNLEDFIDTGLFADHRITRARVRAESAGADFLNLFGYTGAFTAYAAKGGARTTTTVDLSGRYLRWAEENLALNAIHGNHDMVQADVATWLADARRSERRWTLCVVDPPSSSTRAGAELEIQRDHRALLEQTLEVLAPGAVLWFSTNHQAFEPDLEGLAVRALTELTRETTPEDFRRTPHRVWRMTV